MSIGLQACSEQESSVWRVTYILAKSTKEQQEHTSRLTNHFYQHIATRETDYTLEGLRSFVPN